MPEGEDGQESQRVQRVRPENNLLFRLSFRVGKEGMKVGKGVQGMGGCDSTDNSLSVPLTPARSWMC